MSRNKIRLRSMLGSDEANWANSSYRVGLDGIAEVDPEAVGPLLEKGGFVLADPPVVEIPTGFVAVRHTSDPTTTCSHGGASFGLEADGTILVPAVAVRALMDHGFAAVPPPEPAAPVEAPQTTQEQAPKAAEPAEHPPAAEDPAKAAEPAQAPAAAP